jgi:hypothetical protein
MIELRPLDLKRPAVRIGEPLVEAEAVADRAVPGDKVRAVLWKKIAGLELVRNAQSLEQIVVVRQQRLADLKTRKAFALEQRYGESLLGQEGRGGAAGRPSADDDYVAHRGAKRLSSNVLFCISVQCFNAFYHSSGPHRILRP